MDGNKAQRLLHIAGGNEKQMDKTIMTVKTAIAAIRAAQDKAWPVELGLDGVVAALRAQAERDKGCEYCLEHEDMGWGVDSMKRIGRIYLDGNLLTADLYSDSMAVAVCYCPMCGKKLEGKS